MISYRVNVTGIAEAMRYFNQLQQRLNDRGDGLIKATNAVATVWEKNFRGSGSEVGGWQELSEKTMKIRESQGFPSGPVLIRYGALKAVAVDRFMETKVEGRWSMADSYSQHATEGRLDLSPDRAVLSASGMKITNQYGLTSGTVDLPSRPFWFVNENVQNAARDGVVLWIVDEVI